MEKSSTDATVSCVKCGSMMRVKSEMNPIRNVIRDYMKCPKCGFSKVAERPPAVTLSEWLVSEGR